MLWVSSYKSEGVGRGLRVSRVQHSYTISPAMYARLDGIRLQEWEEIIGITPLRPGYENGRRHYFAVSSSRRYELILLLL